jgi:hypothetical protein
MAQEVAARRNWNIAAKEMPPPFGTDAAPFSLSGIPAITLWAGDSSKWDPTYHTRYDTYEHIRPESLSVMLQIVIDMTQRIDKG